MKMININNILLSSKKKVLINWKNGYQNEFRNYDYGLVLIHEDKGSDKTFDVYYVDFIDKFIRY
jgi:hypothetical protein